MRWSAPARAGPESTVDHVRRFPLLALLAALLATACTSVPPEALPAQIDRVDGAPPPETVPSEPATTTTTTTLPDPIEFAGAIAVGGLPGLVISSTTGELLTVAPDQPQGWGTQPTWSRDGTRAVAVVTSAAGPEVVVASSNDTFTHPARRPYFFFSWSGDGRYIAALGPGPAGTTLDILTAEGELATEQQLNTRSFYLAWEPGGDDLVIHRDGTLELVRDPLDLETLEPLGEPGQSFLAPGWIPGTRQIVIVDEADGGRLVRVDVDTGQRDDLGPVGGNAGLVVSPDGSRLLLSHSGPNVELSDDIDIAFPAQDEQDDGEGDGEGDEETAATELVFLESGVRVPINDQLSLWGEWSRTGDTILLLQPGLSTGIWRVVSEDGVRDLGDAPLSQTFLRDYVFFAWQYVESPRLWSPDGDAIVYGSSDRGIPGVYIQPLDGERRRIGSGDVAFWAPELPGRGSSPA